MAIAKRLKDYLKSNKVKFKALKHKAVYTAQEIAAQQHIPGKEFIKTVMVKLNKDKFFMMALPASYRIDFKKLKTAAGAKKVELANEKEFKGFFPDCEIGAMPLFGNLYNMPVVVDKTVEEDKIIVFSAGNHKETIMMRYSDFKDLVKPKVASFSVSLSKKGK